MAREFQEETVGARSTGTGGVSGVAVVLPLLILTLGIICTGCVSTAELLADLTSTDTDVRADAFESLERRVRDLVVDAKEDAEAALELQEIELGIEKIFWKEDADPTLRARLLGLALQGELSTARLFAIGGADDARWQVRLRSVKAIAEIEPDESQEVLTRLLRTDPKLFVRVEAARAMGSIGKDEPAWTEPLIDILSDEALHTSLRYQAYRSVCKLTGRVDPFVPWYWRAGAGR